MEQQTKAPRKRILTTQHSYQSWEQLKRHEAVYLSIGYERLKGRRVPVGTKHKLLLGHDNMWVTLYHE